MKILKMIIDTGQITVGEAARRLQVNPSTASRLLSTMEDEGFVAMGAGKGYVPGPQLLRSEIISNSTNVRALLRPHLERLFHGSNETVHLASLIGTEIHHLDYIEATSHSIVFTNRLNVTRPAHLTAHGKSMLAELSPDELMERYSSPTAVNPRTRSRRIDFKKLLTELEDVRERGYATNFEESERGLAALAVSVGQVQGSRLSLSVALPISRYSKQVERRLVDLLRSGREKAMTELSYS